MRLLLVLFAALLATSCDRRISEVEYRKIARDSASTLDQLHYRGREGADCYIHHRRHLALDCSYVFAAADPGAFPDIPVSARQEDWRRVWVSVISGGCLIWIEGMSPFDRPKSKTTTAPSPFHDLLQNTPELDPEQLTTEP